MASPQDIIKAMVASLHQTRLKALGFRKSGATWVRPLSWPQVINIQLSKWNSSTEASFTVNLGISIEALHVASEGLPLKGSLKEYECDVRTRIGNLLPSKQDKWWVVNQNSDPDELAEDVFVQLDQFGLPWFEKLVDYPAIALVFAERKTPFMAALAYHLANDPVAAEKAMNQAYAESGEFFWPKLKRVALAMGIPVKGMTA